MANVGKQLGPPQVLVLGFLGVILVGTILLSLPISSADGTRTNFIDALFTATSAVCVTGLVVVDTGTYWSTFGQVIILILIEVGGLGFMTFATLFAILLGKKIGLRERLLLQEALNKISFDGVVRLVKHIVLITFSIQGLAALILAARWLELLGWKKALYYGIFHAVSAFNNAGFDIFGGVTGPFSSLSSFVGDPLVNLVISGLFITGGIGFSVIVDIFTKRNWRKLSLHSKIVLTMTAVLIAAGFLGVLVLEAGNPKTLQNLSWGEKIMAAFFQGVTPRTAGFNTINIADLTSATQLLLIVLMFIGASPGSTGGGIKTSTFAGLLSAVRATILGQEDVTAYGRRIPRGLINKAVAVTFVAFCLIMVMTLLLLITEKADFLTTLFETTSAFGTVGLSMGLTPRLTLLGRLIIIITMFVGRVGPLTLAFAIAQRRKKTSIRYPEDKILIG
ncbi:TrkH family potassium uptake protein [Calderihabitans maritimus]|uniref:TrkH family potassium uptake protein n=1 Tax=Calderihabitans maritimus TaxID=1246530 RepID=A0A1Z5HSW4_9FIRM|nr:TrkH family potassium uptake protein [Calderihabitans maritimus]GAW92528.1 TrkH family potassium uptake protein [Calderihabitans maritimus]